MGGRGPERAKLLATKAASCLLNLCGWEHTGSQAAPRCSLLSSFLFWGIVTLKCLSLQVLWITISTPQDRESGSAWSHVHQPWTAGPISHGWDSGWVMVCELAVDEVSGGGGPSQKKLGHCGLEGCPRCVYCSYLYFVCNLCILFLSLLISILVIVSPLCCKFLEPWRLGK